MLPIEQRIHDALPPVKQKRFRHLAEKRHYVACTVAELGCWAGLRDLPALRRHAEILEDALGRLVDDAATVAKLRVAYADRDVALAHLTGKPPADFDCAVCRSGGRYSIEDMLARLPDDRA